MRAPPSPLWGGSIRVADRGGGPRRAQPPPRRFAPTLPTRGRVEESRRGIRSPIMPASITNTTTRYGWVAILLHWLIGIIFIGQFALGFVMMRTSSQRTAFELVQLHKSFGFLVDFDMTLTGKRG